MVIELLEKKPKIVFVSPYCLGFKTPQVRLGIGYLSSYLKKEGDYQTRIINTAYEKMSAKDLAKQIVTKDETIVGFSLKLISQIPYSKETCEELKKLNSNIIIIAGGYIPTLSYEYLHHKIPEIDYMFRGESEETLLKFINAIYEEKEIIHINGLCYMKNGEFISNNLPEPKKNIDKYLFPDRPYLKEQIKNHLSLTMITSRGCVNNCGFCAISTYYRLYSSATKPCWIGRSAKNIVDEIEHFYRNYGLRDFTFSDNNFFGDFEKTKSRAEKLIKELKKRDLKIRFRFACRSDNVEYKLFKKFKDAGLFQVFLGTESVIPRALKYYNKGLSVEQNIKAVEILTELGIDFQLAILWFDRFTTLDEIEKNLEFTKSVKPGQIHHLPSSILRFTERTPLYNKSKNLDFVKYNEEKNLFCYEIQDEKVAQIHEACIEWTNTYYPLYLLLIRLRFDYWHLDEEFTKKAKELYSILKQSEVEYMEKILVFIKNKNNLNPDFYKSIVKEYYQDLFNIQKQAKVLYNKVVYKDSPLYVDFSIKQNEQSDDISFKPITINKLTIKNRFVRSGTGERRANPDGSVSQELIDFYEELGRQDIGLIITGHAYVEMRGRSGYRLPGISSDQFIEGWKKLVEKVHNGGSKIILQINHGGAQSPKDIIKMYSGQTVAPSAVQNYNFGMIPRELTEFEIESLILAFIDAGLRAKKAGFDGIQILCSQGYLISQFLSPYINRRTDKWGGSLENRFRFLKRIYCGLRDKLGPNYPIICKFPMEDYVPNGLTVDEAIWIMRQLDNLGMDAFEVSSGVSSSTRNNCVENILKEDQEAYFLQHIKRIRQEGIKAKLILVGGIRSVPVIKDLLEKESIDLVSMCRTFVCEPDFVKKIKQGTKRTKCISCNKCMNYYKQPTKCYVFDGAEDR
ncbi:radical SAM protein [Candidatus Woesearchaeota archaeon]|nr:radical SAM protein [Candidatus Woesearchaeota archaeon]